MSETYSCITCGKDYKRLKFLTAHNIHQHPQTDPHLYAMWKLPNVETGVKAPLGKGPSVPPRQHDGKRKKKELKRAHRPKQYSVVGTASMSGGNVNRKEIEVVDLRTPSPPPNAGAGPSAHSGSGPRHRRRANGPTWAVGGSSTATPPPRFKNSVPAGFRSTNSVRSKSLGGVQSGKVKPGALEVIMPRYPHNKRPIAPVHTRFSSAPSYPDPEAVHGAQSADSDADDEDNSENENDNENEHGNNKDGDERETENGYESENWNQTVNDHHNHHGKPKNKYHTRVVDEKDEDSLDVDMEEADQADDADPKSPSTARFHSAEPGNDSPSPLNKGKGVKRSPPSDSDDSEGSDSSGPPAKRPSFWGPPSPGSNMVSHEGIFAPKLPPIPKSTKAVKTKPAPFSAASRLPPLPSLVSTSSSISDTPTQQLATITVPNFSDFMRQAKHAALQAEAHSADDLNGDIQLDRGGSSQATIDPKAAAPAALPAVPQAGNDAAARPTRCSTGTCRICHVVSHVAHWFHSLPMFRCEESET